MTLSQRNLLTFGVVDTTLWYGDVAKILTQFRAFIGLKKRCDLPDPLIRWGVPHIYLWNSALLPKPFDWGVELSVVGHVTLDDSAGLNQRKRKKRDRERQRFKWPSELIDFAFQTPSLPVIYFGISTRPMTSDDLDELLQKVDVAANSPDNQIRIIFQTREASINKPGTCRYSNVRQIPSDLPYARLFREQTPFSTTF